MPNGALRCYFFFQVYLAAIASLLFPIIINPVLFALWAYFTSRLARKKKWKLTNARNECASSTSDVNAI